MKECKIKHIINYQLKHFVTVVSEMDFLFPTVWAAERRLGPLVPLFTPPVSPTKPSELQVIPAPLTVCRELHSNKRAWDHLKNSFIQQTDKDLNSPCILPLCSRTAPTQKPSQRQWTLPSSQSATTTNNFQFTWISHKTCFCDIVSMHFNLPS